MKCGEWLRELTPDEASWARGCYNGMLSKAKPVGYRSHDPCSQVEPGRFDQKQDNRDEAILTGGPRCFLLPYWISFVSKHGQIPQLRSYYLAEAQKKARKNAKKLKVKYNPSTVVPVYCELSHVCGDNHCIKPTHIVCEKKKDNFGRYKYCHSVIREWVNRNKMNPFMSTLGLVTAATAGVVCQHDPKCFLNIDKIKKKKRRLPQDIDEEERRHPRRAPKRHRVNNDMFGVKSSRSVAAEEFRIKRTVIYDGQKGWIDEVDGDRINICLPQGARRKAKSKWVRKSSVTFPQRQ